MKIIELLTKIANGEEVPERIKYDTKEMKYDHNKQDYLGYYSNGNGEWLFQYLFDRCRNTEHFINDEVEIIEEQDKEIERLHSIIKEVRDNLENSIKSINEKLKNNKEPFEVIDGRIQYINDYRVVRLKAFRTKCKELLEILDKKENI